MLKKILFVLFLCISTAMFSQKTLQKLTAAPNPFYTNTSIKFTATKKIPAFLIVKNVLGKTVYKKKITTKIGTNTIPFTRANLKSGMYIFAIHSKKEMVSKRFVIK
ncbi:MAG: T9SS type A sorting domain-containing protein [Flavobacteriaceae bacterium]|nr:T9SS type A sorting domain-containing protein [Flavobacteriaceae bacterium]